MIARLLLSTDPKKRIEEINKILDSNLTRGLTTQGKGNANHPDLLYIKTGEKLGIAEARKIKAHFSLKPYSAKGRVVAIEEAESMTGEAQNALLKTLEELPQEAILILAASSDSNFLPTVLSRCQITRLDISKSDFTYSTKISGEDLEELLNSTTEKRFEYIEKLKDKEEFLYAITQFFRQKLVAPDQRKGSSLAKQELNKFLKELLLAEEWAKQNVNIRAILEYLMLVMPHDI